MPPTIPFKLTVCGIDELPGHSAAGITHVLSILDPDWPAPEAFAAFGAHERLELRFHDVIEDTPGMLAPLAGHVAQVLAFGRTLPLAEGAAEQASGAHLLVHCHAGVSRSTAAMILIVAQARPDLPAEDVAREIFRIRSKAWPNLRIIEMGDAMLGRGGEIVAAVTAIYREQLATRPQIGAFMTEAGRAREVAAGQRAPGGLD